MRLVNWTKEEISFLVDNWGELSVPQLAKRLDRTEYAVRKKALDMKLGGQLFAQEAMLVTHLSNAIGADQRTVIKWIISAGLKAKRYTPYHGRTYYMVKLDDWWKWAETNQNKWNSLRFPLLSLGKEPAWMELKRKQDLLNRLPVKRPWTSEDLARLDWYLTNTNLTYREIGKIINRSERAIQNIVVRRKAV